MEHVSMYLDPEWSYPPLTRSRAQRCAAEATAPQPPSLVRLSIGFKQSSMTNTFGYGYGKDDHPNKN